ncbi:hypothetical protein C2134_08605 [Chromobacterium sinusclupearum]|uniref:Lipoprotein n=1 Tax=Chromobacterium sinusclupearum TaxID=2077146 RepID=A0A2K4MPU6_9NEIS|nr:hypothetical protein [Chromobacterium sinusclupearum]POA99126.1 hypothetical protein C2134_08605 [Chromobacterium sinusclupearum]
MKKQLIALALPALLLAATCRADDAGPQDNYARIRIFQRNGVGLGLFPHHDCYRFSLMGNNDDIVESQAFKSFIHLANNKSIGMPETPNTHAQAERSKLFSQDYYQEYKLPAGEITTLTASFSDVSNWRCNTLAVKFKPQAGTDYEAMLNVDMDSKTCHLVIGSIPHDNPDAALEPLPNLAPASYCPDDK